MDQVFCSERSRQACEDLIGSAGTAQMYILIECPTPWTETALNSPAIPASMRSEAQQLLQEIQQGKFTLCPQGLRPLLIYNRQLQQENRTRVFILQKQPGMFRGYQKQEYCVSGLDEVVPLIRAYFQGQTLPHLKVESSTREILICTHGSHDRCCAKYGNPFYRQALATVADLYLENVRIWQSSHFGGHRFAPTMIDFPEGRYYGRLTAAALRAILQHAGDLHCLKTSYRGWSPLPPAAQVLERELLLQYGWDWFNCGISYQIISQDEARSYTHLKMTVEQPDGSRASYQAEIIPDESKAVVFKVSCGRKEPSKVVPLVIQNLAKIE